MRSAFPDVIRIIPHRPPMVMIDRYSRVSDTHGTAEKMFSRKDYGCEDGYVLQAVLVECIAQTVAAHHGYSQMETGSGSPAMGMLVAIDSFDFFHPVQEDETITITVHKTDEIGPFHLIQGEILCRRKIMARGRMKIFNSADNQGEKR
ncbi:MAG: hypothetical protein RBR67_13940 [Desulfobacterium sp.]|nr:hypothetical protein [Desulfobacterium sp.]